MADRNKRKLIVGLTFLIAAFACILVIIYLLVDTQRAQVAEIGTLSEELDFQTSEREIAQRRAGELEGQVGSTLYLDRVIEEARSVYGEEEKLRKEGYLWIDRESETFVVTLGILNGLDKGNYLGIYDGTDKLGFVRVEMPLDVISYVRPVNKRMDQFAEDYYRVVIE